MSGRNLLRFYFNQYEKALADFEKGEMDSAEDACCEFITEFQCPRLIQIQAWQLRSLCTKDYWLAKSHLDSALEVIQRMDDDADKTVAQYKMHTEIMLAEIEIAWMKRWADEDVSPPTEETVEDTVVYADTEMKVDDTEVEQQRQDLEQLSLAPDVRGGSSPNPELPGGAERPWEKAEDGDQEPLTPVPSSPPKGDDEMEQ